MTNYEYKKTLFIVAIIGALFVSLVIYILKPFPQNPLITQKSNFVVVDTYKGCDVIQWTDGSLATYKYFLDCNNK